MQPLPFVMSSYWSLDTAHHESMTPFASHDAPLNSANHLAHVIIQKIMKAKCIDGIVIICGPLLFSILFILAYSLLQVLEYLFKLAFQTSDHPMVFSNLLNTTTHANNVIWERIL